MLPIVVRINVGMKWITPVEIRVPPIKTTRSLGEGGNTFSINEKRKRVT